MNVVHPDWDQGIEANDHVANIATIGVPTSTFLIPFSTQIQLVICFIYQGRIDLRIKMPDRPGFVQQLLDRPLPPLTPPKLGDTSNSPYHLKIQSEIADLKCHPALESAVSHRTSREQITSTQMLVGDTGYLSLKIQVY